MRQQIIATLTQVGQILNAKAPDDAAGFKGFLGFGGVRVTEAEKASKAWLKHIAEKVAEASSEGCQGAGGAVIQLRQECPSTGRDANIVIKQELISCSSRNNPVQSPLVRRAI